MSEFDVIKIPKIGRLVGRDFELSDPLPPNHPDWQLPYVLVDPHIMYPAVIARIRECLTQNIFPAELIQNRPREDGTPDINLERAKALLQNARKLPPEAWDDALAHRESFDSPVGYVEWNKRPDLEVYVKSARDKIERLWNRGDALEVAMGWFLQALRCRIGGSRVEILAGRDGKADGRAFNYYKR